MTANHKISSLDLELNLKFPTAFFFDLDHYAENVQEKAYLFSNLVHETGIWIGAHTKTMRMNSI